VTILKAISFLEGHKSDKKITSKITSSRGPSRVVIVDEQENKTLNVCGDSKQN
jgi:hypothetical protein